MDFFVTVRHLRRLDDTNTISPFGGVTVLAAVDLKDPDNRTINYSLAFCSSKDLFCKATGRMTALERALAGETYECAYTDFETGGGIMDQIAEDIMTGFDESDEVYRLFMRSQDYYG